MTFKYGFTFPITGGNKLHRFKTWASEYAPEVEYVLPPQTPVETETMTIRLRSLEDRRLLIERLAAAKP